MCSFNGVSRDDEKMNLNQGVHCDDSGTLVITFYQTVFGIGSVVRCCRSSTTRPKHLYCPTPFCELFEPRGTEIAISILAGYDKEGKIRPRHELRQLRGESSLHCRCQQRRKSLFRYLVPIHQLSATVLKAIPVGEYCLLGVRPALPVGILSASLSANVPL
jgi:hypothetical protein